MTRYTRWVLSWCVAAKLLTAGLILVTGCGCDSLGFKQQQYRNPHQKQWNLAVVPFVNHSGSDALDEKGLLSITDSFYTELQRVNGIVVVPVPRVQAVMAQMGMRNVSSPDDALMVAQSLGVDGVIVGAITHYKPYYPPVMGMMIQLYAPDKVDNKPEMQHVDPAKLALAGKPFRIGSARQLQARLMVVKIVDAGTKPTLKQLQEYARLRNGQNTPAGLERYMTRKNYPAFVSYEIIRDMLRQERKRVQNKERLLRNREQKEAN